MDTLASGKARQYHLVLPEIHPSALAIIREILDAHLRLWEKTELGFLIALGVTELLTNVHKHTRGDCELLVRDMPDGVLVAVTDFDAGLPAIKEPGETEESGRGLFLLSTLADELSVQPLRLGKRIRFLVREGLQLDGPC